MKLLKINPPYQKSTKEVNFYGMTFSVDSKTNVMAIEINGDVMGFIMNNPKDLIATKSNFWNTKKLSRFPWACYGKVDLEGIDWKTTKVIF